MILVLLACFTIVCYRRCCLNYKASSLAISFSRRVQGQVFKEERNNDYGIYTENNVAVAEVVDQNTNYEQSESQAPGPVYDYENWEDDYDKMYDKMD